jgi:hypothetical protein
MGKGADYIVRIGTHTYARREQGFPTDAAASRGGPDGV